MCLQYNIHLFIAEGPKFFNKNIRTKLKFSVISNVIVKKMSSIEDFS